MSGMARSRDGWVIPNRWKCRGAGKSHRRLHNEYLAVKRLLVKKDRHNGRVEISAQLRESTDDAER